MALSYTKKLDFYDSLFVAFAVCIIVTNVVWFISDNSINGTDSANHLLFSIDFYYRLSEAIGRDTLFFNKIGDIIKVLGTPMPGMGSVYWPNGVNLTAYFCYSLFGKSLFAAKMAILPYLFVLLYSTYSIGRFLHSKFVGFMAAFYLFCYPIIFQSSRQYQLDLPLTAFVALILYLLLRADRFTNTKYSLLLGLACGYAMLIKGQVVLFVACPFLYILYRLGWESGQGIVHNPLKSKQLRNVLMVLIVSGLIASIWWGSKINGAIASLATHIFDPAKNLDRTPFPWGKKYSLGCVFFYVWTLFYSSVRPFLSLLMIFLLPALLREKFQHKSLYIVWIIPPLLLFSLVFTIKHDRFMMPILPALALMTAGGLQGVTNKKLKYSLIGVSMIFCLCQFYVLSCDGYAYRSASIGKCKVFGECGFGSHYETGKPCLEDLKIDDVGRIIRNNNTTGHGPRILIVDTSNTRPQYSEMYFWLRSKDGSLLISDLRNLFYEPGRMGGIDFVVCHSSGGSPTNHFAARRYRRSMRNLYFNELKPFEVRVQQRGEMQEWEKFLESVEDAGSNFALIHKVSDRNTVYYIYKKKAEAPG